MAQPSTTLSDALLADIQGFITSGYGHLPLAAYLLLEIHDARGAQRWLAQIISLVTTSEPWPVTPGGEKLKPSSALNLAVTAPGLAALGLPQQVLCTFPVEFHEGMALPDRSAILGDTEESAPGKWELGGPGNPPIHVVLILHGKSAEVVRDICSVQRKLIEDTAGAVTELTNLTQQGYRPDAGNEPFGFRDGMGQPSIQGISEHGVPTGEFILGYQNHYQLFPPTPVVGAELDGGEILPPLKNPYHAAARLRDLGVNGSYVVYRKLQQDVAAFWQLMKREAVRIRGKEDGGFMVWLASRFVGRWPSGAPLVLTPDADDPRLGEHNDFLYAGDADGLACPLGAHIRRTNPRDVLKPYGTEQSLSMTEAHRMLRRGRTFGPALFDPRLLEDPKSDASTRVLASLEDDGQARGTHFFCVNASIKSQFEFVQHTWCNNPNFGGLNDNKDPLVGDNNRTDEPSNHMTIPRRPLRERTAALPRFVTVKGGAYLFMPSLTALRFLAAFTPSA